MQWNILKRLICNGNNKRLWIFFTFVLGIFPFSTCCIHMCLQWTVRQDILQIICKVDELQLPVYIHNNFGMEVARCSTPFPYPLCTAAYNNTTVQQNIITNETIVLIRGKIDQSINGNWSCRHGFGRNKYKAFTDIKVLRLKGNIFFYANGFNRFCIFLI